MLSLRPSDLRIPRTWEIIAGADTGTYLGGLIAAVSPVYDLYVLEEFTNYHYTGDGTIEEDDVTVNEWMRNFAARLKYWTKQPRNFAWADANTTFKSEIGYGFRFRMNTHPLEYRTEVTRSYVRRGNIHIPSWVTILPYEMEEAKYPEESTISGRHVRIKRKDHVLDCLEHICSRKPHPKFVMEVAQKRSVMDRVLDLHRMGPRPGPPVDPHLGVN